MGANRYPNVLAEARDKGAYVRQVGNWNECEVGDICRLPNLPEDYLDGFNVLSPHETKWVADPWAGAPPDDSVWEFKPIKHSGLEGQNWFQRVK